jgi:ArsR family transcriptional regulator, lead/cadmium/zinc/bismuth-responsive transcriptional repressor
MADDCCDLLCLDLEKAEALRRQRLDGERAFRLAERAKALSDPTRLLIALVLQATDEACVCDLAWTVERSDKLVSHHVRALRAAGLVRSRRDGKMVMYRLTEAGDALLAVLQPEHDVASARARGRQE